MRDSGADVELTLAEKLDWLQEWMKELEGRWHVEPEEMFPPPISEERLVVFEQRYSITLPEELRAVITQISDSLNIWLPLDSWESPPEVGGRWLNAQNLLLPFVPEEVHDCSYVPDEEQETVEDDPQRQMFEDDFERLKNSLTRGTLWLAGSLDDLGCGYFLVVTGDTRGTIWKIYQDIGMDASYFVHLTCFGSLMDAIEDMDEWL